MGTAAVAVCPIETSLLAHRGGGVCSMRPSVRDAISVADSVATSVTRVGADGRRQAVAVAQMCTG